MGKPTALGLARMMVDNAIVADVRRGEGGALVIQSAIESPAPIKAGKRYLMLDTEEATLLTKRIMAGEHALMLAAVKRTVLKRRG